MSIDNLDSLDVDDLFASQDRVKKVNGKRKGNRVELALCKKLTNHFQQTFSRSVGSGNRWGQVSNMPEHAKQTLIGDLCVPEKFKWVIECKGGYDNAVDFSNIVSSDCSTLEGFIEQSSKDSNMSHRLPIIMWKRSRKPWVSVVRFDDLPNLNLFDQYIYYKKWVVVSLNELLNKTETNFWFID